jgi:hypothetical protein
MFRRRNNRCLSQVSMPSFVWNVLLVTVKKGKAIPVTGRGGLYGCETLKLLHFLDSWLTDGGKVVSLTRRLHFNPQEDSWYSLLEAGSTLGP